MGRIEESEYKNIFPEARETVRDILGRVENEPGFTLTKYGHAATALAVSVRAAASLGYDEGTQRARLKECAEEFIVKYGEGIIDYLRPELREALGLDGDDE